MAVLQPVEIPKEKGVHTKKAGRQLELYVYKNTEYYRTESGQARHKCVCIGKVCTDDPSKMIPNKKYQQLCNVDDQTQTLTHGDSNPIENDDSSPTVENQNNFLNKCNGVWHFGFTYVVFKIAQDLGLIDVLKKILGYDIAMNIIAIAAYIISQGNSMDGMEDWQDCTYLPYQAPIFSSQLISTLFDSLDYSIKQAFIKGWVEKNEHEDSICYDVTSFSSYSTNNEEVEGGYNRDNEKLPQFNMGYFSSLSTRRPLAYTVYNGSLNDSSNLLYVLDDVSDVGLKNYHLVADGGFFFEKCFKSLKKHMKSFTVGMPLERNVSKKIVDSVMNDIHSYKYRVPEFHIQCVEVSDKIYRTKGRVLVYYDQGKADDENSSLDKKIAEYANELKALARLPRAKKYKKYFKLTAHENDKGFDFEIDADKVDSIIKYHGYFLIFTTNKEFSPGEVLHHYREKDVDEKMFFQIKNPMRGKRAKTHSLETTEGKMFVTFIATIIRTEIHGLVRAYLISHSISMKKVKDKLNNIILAFDSEGYHLVKEITKEQREMLTELGAYESLRNAIDQLNSDNC